MFFRREYLNSESLDKKKVPFDLTGWKTASPEVLCHILFVFVFVCPSDCFNTLMVELLTLLSFSFSRPIGYTGATERLRLRRFRLQGTIKVFLLRSDEKNHL